MRTAWVNQLNLAIARTSAPTILIAHSLGCQLVAAWAAHSRHTARVRGALLVAPPDTERDDMPPNLYNWRPIVRERLPFASLVVASSDDPYCALPRAERMAAFRSVWGDLCDESWELADVDDDANDSDTGEASEEGARGRRPPRPSKITTVLRSLAFVSVKVPTLQTLAGVDDATSAVMRDLRTAVRLEQIRQHESALKRHLETLPAIAPVRV